MKRIAICDDEPQILEELETYIDEYASLHHIVLQAVKYSSAEQLLCSGRAFDLAILDIHMQGMDGMQAARRLRELGCDCPIIFLTALKDYVFDAFDVDAVNYLLKPVDQQKLFDSIGKALRKDTDGLLVKLGHDYRKIRFADILFIEAMGRKVAIHLEHETLEYYQKFRELQGLLKGGFFAPHRSFLVNLEHIKALDGNDAVMDNGVRVPIAKGKKPELAKRLLAHFQGGS